VLNFETNRIMHRHGNDWVEMRPVDAHSPDARDPERELLRGERLFRCSACDEEIQVTTEDPAHRPT
jgi:hypothetical protein